MKGLKIIVSIFAVLVVSGGAQGRVVFENSDTADSDATAQEQASSAQLTETTDSLALPSAVESEAGPIFHQGTVLESPKNEVPVVPARPTQGRTFHHLAKLHHSIEYKLNSLFAKLISPFLQGHGDPHYFPQSPYSYNGGNEIYRKDVGAEPQHPLKKLMEPLEYLMDHPINFRQRLANLHHRLGKRSLEQVEPSGRQPKTLYKIIPNFEQKVGAVMKRILGPIYGSQPTGGFFEEGTPYKSDLQAGQQAPVLRFTNFMKILPQLFQRMSQMLRVPQRLAGTPVVQRSNYAQ